MKLGSGPGQSSKGTGINGGGTSTGSGGQTQSGKQNTLQNITKCLTITQITKVPHQISKLKSWNTQHECKQLYFFWISSGIVLMKEI